MFFAQLCVLIRETEQSFDGLAALLVFVDGIYSCWQQDSHKPTLIAVRSIVQYTESDVFGCRRVKLQHVSFRDV